MWIWLSFLGIGALSGLLAGLFGIGGGIVIVPAMWYLIPYLPIPDNLQMSLILGTSFGCIVITTIVASYRHYRLGNVQWQLVKVLALTMMITAYVASGLITDLDRSLMGKIFGGILIFIALRMLFKRQKSPPKKYFTTVNTILTGIIIGLISSIAGVGGGSFVVPFLSSRGLEIRKAIGTAGFCSLCFGLASAGSYIFRGWNVLDLPPHCLGFIYLPALLGITFASVFTAQIGAKLVNKLPVTTLHKIFAVFLIGVAISMLFK